MKVFISWSGNRSKAVAAALRDWLPEVIQAVKPWMSEADIDAGARWSDALGRELEDTQFGIICLTPDNLTAPWIHFEAGATAKVVDKSRVCPYLLDVSTSDVDWPLAQFQAKLANKVGTWDIVRSINASRGEAALPDNLLKKAFERCWGDLKKAIDDVPPPSQEQEQQRPPEQMIPEILELVRGLARLRPAESMAKDVADGHMRYLAKQLGLLVEHHSREGLGSPSSHGPVNSSTFVSTLPSGGREHGPNDESDT